LAVQLLLVRAQARQVRQVRQVLEPPGRLRPRLLLVLRLLLWGRLALVRLHRLSELKP
jgi:hypothetical protein